MITKKEAQAYIDAIIALRDSATDKQASEAAILYPEWEIEKEYTEKDRLYGLKCNNTFPIKD